MNSSSVRKQPTPTTRQLPLMWLLLGCYALAAILPDPGNQLRHWHWGHLPWSQGAIRSSHWLLVGLLFCVGLGTKTEWRSSLVRQPRQLFSQLVAVWLVPWCIWLLCLMMFRGVLIASGYQEFLVGASVVMAMPAAVSSITWTQLARGNAATALILVGLMTVTCPLITPMFVLFVVPIVPQSGLTVADFHSLLEVLGMFVVAPFLVGGWLRHAISERHQHSMQGFARYGALVLLLLLNYTNAASAIPHLVKSSDWTTRLGFPMAALLLQALVAIGAAAMAQSMCSASDELPGLAFVGSMKNTGTALVLAGSHFPEHSGVALTVIFFTLGQHLTSGLLMRWMSDPTRSLNYGGDASADAGSADLPPSA